MAAQSPLRLLDCYADPVLRESDHLSMVACMQDHDYYLCGHLYLLLFLLPYCCRIDVCTNTLFNAMCINALFTYMCLTMIYPGLQIIPLVVWHSLRVNAVNVRLQK